MYHCKCSNKSKQQIRIKHSDKNIYTKCKTCAKRSKQSIDSLKLKFPHTYQLSNGNIEKFILLLKKGVYPYEYMDDWEKFNETEIPSIEDHYSNLHLENISKGDHKHALKVKNTFNIKNLGEYHDLYVQLDTCQLADTFEQFRSLCLKEYKLDPSYFCATPVLAFEACLKITKVELELLRDIDMVLMFEKGIRGGISQAIQRYAFGNNKCMPNYNSKAPSTYLMYVDANNLYGYAMCKKLPLIILNGVMLQKCLQVILLKTMMKIVIHDIYLKQISTILKNYMNHIETYHFYLLKKKKYLVLLKIKKSMLYTWQH